MNTPPDDRLPLVRAYAWASQATTVAIGMVVPGLIGHYLDNVWGTRPLLIILGFVVGMTLGIWRLLRMAQGWSLGDRNQQPPRQT